MPDSVDDRVVFMKEHCFEEHSLRSIFINKGNNF